MTRKSIALALILLAAPAAAAAEEPANRSLGACKSIVGGHAAANFAEFTEEELKDKMCLSSLSVVRSADPMAQMECRLAYKALFGEFSKRHPGKEMADVYGRC